MLKEIFNLGKNSIIYGAGSVITKFIGLFTLPLFTSFLTPEEYGIIAMLSLLTMVAQPVFSLGLTAAMGPSYFKKNTKKNKSEVVWSAFLLNFFGACSLIIVSLIFPRSIANLIRLSSQYYPLVSLQLVGCAFTVMTTAFLQSVQFEKKAKIYVIVTAATAITAIAVSLITVVFFDLGVKGMLIGQISGNVLTFLFFLIIAITFTEPKFSLSVMKELLKQGLPLVPSFAFLFLLMQSNKYLLEWIIGMDAVGIYSIGFNLGVVMRIVTQGVTTAWYPFFMGYSVKQREAETIFGKIFSYYIIGAGTIALCFFLFAKPVVLILTQEVYYKAYIAIGLVATAQYFIGIYSMLLPGMYFQKEIYMQTIIQLIAVIFSLPITFLLIKGEGVMGAAIGLAIGHILLAAFTFLWNKCRKNKYVKIKYEWKRITLFLIVYISISTIFLVININGILFNVIIAFLFLIFILFVNIQLLTVEEVKIIPILKRLKIKC